MRSLYVFLTLLILFSGLHELALAKDAGLLSKKSPHSVTRTLDRFATVLESKGLTIFARIDHAKGAEKVGQKLRPTELIIFGSPKIGTALMQANQLSGLSLPLKALAYEDEKGQVWLVYAPPQDLKTRYGLEGRDAVIEKMTGALDKLTGAAVKPE